MPTPSVRAWLEKHTWWLGAVFAVALTYFFVGDPAVRAANQGLDWPVALTYAQNVLLVSSLLVFSRTMGATIELAWITCVFCVLALPQGWNLTGWVPTLAEGSTGQLALGCLLFAAAAWLRGRPIEAAVFAFWGVAAAGWRPVFGWNARGLPGFAQLAMLAVMGLAELPPHGRAYLRLLAAACVACVFPAATALLMLLVAPIAIEYLLERSRSGEVVSVWLAGALFILVAMEGGGFYWAATGALFLATKRPRTALGVFSAWVFLLVLRGTLGWRQLRGALAPGASIDATELVFALVVSGALAWVTTAPAKTLAARWWRVVAPSALFLGVSLVLVGFRAAEESGRMRDPVPVANYEARQWAREHTAKDARFVVAARNVPWPSSMTVPTPSDGRAPASLEDAELVTFSRGQKAEYLVVPRDRAMPLPKLYENRELAIYAVR